MPPDPVNLEQLLQETPAAAPAIVHPEAGLTFANPNADGSIPAGFVTEDPRAAAQSTIDAALEERYGGAGQTALAGLEGGFSALTFGGSDALLKALGGDVADRAKANPLARAVGEIGTTVGTTILTGGLGGAAKGALGGVLAKTTPLGMLTSRTGKLASSIGGVKGLMLAEGAEGLATSAGGLVSKLSIKDEELTAKAALLDLGLGTVVGLGAGGVTGLLFKGGKAAKHLASDKGPGIDLTTVEGQDFRSVLNTAVKDLDRADNDIISNVAVRRKADETGQVFVKSVKDDYLASAQRDLTTLGVNVEKSADAVLQVPVTPTVPAGINRIADVPDEVFADKYTSRNILQLLDESTEDLRTFGALSPKLSRMRQRIGKEITEFDKDIGTGATKGRSKLYGPENEYKTTADIPAVKKLLQEYQDEIVAQAQKSGNDAVAFDLINGVDRGGVRKLGLVDIFDDVNESLAPIVAKEQADLARYGAIQAARSEAAAASKAFQDMGGFGDTVSLGAAPGEALLRGKAGQDYLDSLTKLARETGQEIPESFAKNMAKLQDDLALVAQQGAKNNPITGKDLQELRQARVAFRSDDWSPEKFLAKTETEALAQLSRLDNYWNNLNNAGNKLAIPGMISKLEENSLQLTNRLESLTGLSGKDIDRAYAKIAEARGGPPVAFKGPTADLHRAWVVNQAMKEGGELGDSIKQLASRADALKPSFGKRILQSGVRRAAGYLGFSAGNAVGGPFVGAALAGSVSTAVSRGLRTGGFLSTATGALLKGVSTAANLTAKGTRQIGLNVGSVVRQTSFGGEEKPSKNESSRGSYNRLTKELTDAMVNPGTQTRINESLGEIRDVNWGVGDKMEVMAMDALKYLADNIPKDPGVLQKWGMSTWKPTDAQVLEFNNRVAAVVNPLNSIQRFMGGGGSPAEADAIKNVHPEIFREFQSAFMDNLVTMRDKVSGATRVRLGILFDAPIDSRLRPEFRTFMKEHWIARAEEQKPLDVNAGMNPEQPSPAQKLLG